MADRLIFTRNNTDTGRTCRVYETQNGMYFRYEVKQGADIVADGCFDRDEREQCFADAIAALDYVEPDGCDEEV